MSLGKRVILLNNDMYSKDAPFDVSSYFYIHYSSIDKIEERWNKKMPKFLGELLNNYLNFELDFIIRYINFSLLAVGYTSFF